MLSQAGRRRANEPAVVAGAARLLVRAAKAGFQLGALATGQIGPAMGIALQATSLLLGQVSPVEQTQVRQALEDYYVAKRNPSQPSQTAPAPP